LIAAIIAFIAAYGLAHTLRPVTTHLGDIVTITAGSLAWLLAAFVILTVTGSKLPAQVLRRVRVGIRKHLLQLNPNLHRIRPVNLARHIVLLLPVYVRKTWCSTIP
jgi:hypothetical protein